MYTQRDIHLGTHSEAWAAYNASFGAPDGQIYRSIGRDLYRQALRERFDELFRRSDQQNQLLDLVWFGGSAGNPRSD